jgi:hypothetical protein
MFTKKDVDGRDKPGHDESIAGTARQPLVPAKAGIQGHMTLRFWIPACAGMSGESVRAE